jgi:hypothetical protein
LIRLLILRLARRWGLLIVGILLAIGGLTLGFSSHQITYHNGAKGSIAHYLSGDTPDLGYLQMDGSPALYYVNEKDFNPVITSANSFGRGNIISFVYTPDETKEIDEKAANSTTHLVGTGYKVVQIMLFDDTGKLQQVFTSSEYSQSPRGHYENNWTASAVLLVLGFLVTGLALFLRLRRKAAF